ncbi:hypothetical protein A2331_04865 [Candidatus Falkowbacteria bacterium RIFOXYB2_FULL_34_18]|uniref:Uncharacterized protein n=1 Tax=Candidatus Falkowbacteria bacterium RIFOXYD2_FULL_34_120 TaxID=1798007 RepID=A0A1F5TNW7_9BACT|nr:MAG: hypothetical protein A2331_04865 [Candidatus Falkowbacteria bacterium RIFOXYB2_FULL_34_18]OGF28848.1 MAG: hypothetical protein A2500_00510 [Candidatus Falkowbacteria bacterium RIFOXYC12_FULL_34_55]OGF35779.1 MAG: hypothetical protein A2466_04560 [Candidatus Falkowbacteria bacterium RIFOXYC2_FULL_34_220]OGF38445.1 MAG: hypothetical protein A2515_02000 [Candidatus Falkowbacteria bacterium RIFOXYD12_FULL_34_57]OGF40499.1 MAG: hypothetical protein A2531_02925 [Candidatus Falkowbacteria bact
MNEEQPKSLGKKILTVVITVIVTIFLLCIIILVWVLVKNPLNVRGVILFKLGWIDKPVQIMPSIKNNENTTEEIINVTTNPESEKITPITQTAPTTQTIPMTEEQRRAVENFGIDPDSIVITPAMEDCFVEKLGEQRVSEIKNGSAPGVLEMVKASSCL